MNLTFDSKSDQTALISAINFILYHNSTTIHARLRPFSRCFVLAPILSLSKTHDTFTTMSRCVRSGSILGFTILPDFRRWSRKLLKKRHFRRDCDPDLAAARNVSSPPEYFAAGETICPGHSSPQGENKQLRSSCFAVRRQGICCEAHFCRREGEEICFWARFWARFVLLQGTMQMNGAPSTL